jgi:hypothetical protein
VLTEAVALLKEATKLVAGKVEEAVHLGLGTLEVLYTEMA